MGNSSSTPNNAKPVNASDFDETFVLKLNEPRDLIQVCSALDRIGYNIKATSQTHHPENSKNKPREVYIWLDGKRNQEFVASLNSQVEPQPFRLPGTHVVSVKGKTYRDVIDETSTLQTQGYNVTAVPSPVDLNYEKQYYLQVSS